VIPKDRSQRLRRTIELIFDRSTITETLESRLKRVNPVLRGWGNFYRHAWGSKRVFTGIDNYLWWTVNRWLRKKHPDSNMTQLAAQYGWHKPRQRTLRWRDGVTVPVALAAIRVAPYHLGSQLGPHFA
jgi:RNA-directed DNA polymerase